MNNKTKSSSLNIVNKNLKDEICIALDQLLESDGNLIVRKAIAETVLSLCSDSDEETSNKVFLPIINKIFSNIYELILEKGLANNDNRALAMVLISNLGTISKLIDISQYRTKLIS